MLTTTSPSAAARTAEPVDAGMSIPIWFELAPSVGEDLPPNPEEIELPDGHGQMNLMFPIFCAAAVFAFDEDDAVVAFAAFFPASAAAFDAASAAALDSSAAFAAAAFLASSSFLRIWII